MQELELAAVLTDVAERLEGVQEATTGRAAKAGVSRDVTQCLARTLLTETEDDAESALEGLHKITTGLWHVPPFAKSV